MVGEMATLLLEQGVFICCLNSLETYSRKLYKWCKGYKDDLQTLMKHLGNFSVINLQFENNDCAVLHQCSPVYPSCNEEC